MHPSAWKRPASHRRPKWLPCCRDKWKKAACHRIKNLTHF
jgi:hypothetical protein